MIFFLNPSPIFCMAKHPAMLRGTAREVGNSSGLLHSRYFNRQKRNKKERVHRSDVPSLYRAEDEAQTRDPQLGRLMLYQLSYFRNLFLWAKMDSNHRRRKPADLQSAPFGHSGICPESECKDSTLILIYKRNRAFLLPSPPLRRLYCPIFLRPYPLPVAWYRSSTPRR